MFSFFPDPPPPEIEEAANRIPILKAVRNNNITELRRLIEEGADVNTHAPGGGKTPLHIATHLNLFSIVKLLIEFHADVNAVTDRKFTPIHVAAKFGHCKILKLLADAGASVNATSDVGCTPLHEAAASGHEDAVTMLIELNADLNIRDSRFHLTAANLAHENNHHSITEKIANAMHYTQRFIQNIHYIIFNWKRFMSLQQNATASQFLEDFSQILQPINDGDEFFLKVSEKLKSPEFTSFKETLSPMRKLIISNMKQYNSDKTAAADQNAVVSTASASSTTSSTSPKR